MNINLRTTVAKIMEIVRRSGAGCLLIRDLASIRYLTGCEFHSSGDAVVLVRPDGVVLFTDARYNQVKSKTAKLPIRVVIWDRKDVPGDIFAQATRGKRRGRMIIGYEKDSGSIPDGFAQKLRVARRRKRWQQKVSVRAIPDLMHLVRIIKTPAEIDLLRLAHQKADKALRNILSRIRPGVTEKQIAQWLNSELRKQSGEDELSFATIVASGPNGAYAHATPTDRKIRRGDLVTIDYGCTYQGYHTDTTRTIIVGTLEPKAEAIFNTVLLAQQTAQKTARPGMTGTRLDKIARDIIETAGYGKQFIHSLGHGVGMDEHEKPHITPNEKFGKNVLRVGMVFSIEPGIYIEGFTGVRLENTVVMTRTGAKPLSSLPMILRIAA